MKEHIFEDRPRPNPPDERPFDTRKFQQIIWSDFDKENGGHPKCTKSGYVGNHETPAPEHSWRPVYDYTGDDYNSAAVIFACNNCGWCVEYRKREHRWMGHEGPFDEYWRYDRV